MYEISIVCSMYVYIWFIHSTSLTPWNFGRVRDFPQSFYGKNYACSRITPRTLLTTYTTHPVLCRNRRARTGRRDRPRAGYVIFGPTEKYRIDLDASLDFLLPQVDLTGDKIWGQISQKNGRVFRTAILLRLLTNYTTHPGERLREVRSDEKFKVPGAWCMSWARCVV